MSTQLEIEKLEEKLVSAMLSSDVNTLDALIADDLIFTDHLGRLITKAMDLDAHARGQVQISSILPSEEKIKLCDGFAIVSVKMYIKGSYANEAFEGTNRYTRVWSPKGDSWKIIAGHSSIVNE